MPKLYRPAGKCQEGYEGGLTTAVDRIPECHLGSELTAKRSDNCPSELGPSFLLALIHRLHWEGGLLFAWFYLLPALNIRAAFPPGLWGASHRRATSPGSVHLAARPGAAAARKLSLFTHLQATATGPLPAAPREA